MPTTTPSAPLLVPGLRQAQPELQAPPLRGLAVRLVVEDGLPYRAASSYVVFRDGIPVRHGEVQLGIRIKKTRKYLCGKPDDLRRYPWAWWTWRRLRANTMEDGLTRLTAAAAALVEPELDEMMRLRGVHSRCDEGR